MSHSVGRFQNLGKSRINSSDCHWHCHKKSETLWTPLLSCAEVYHVNNSEAIRNMWNVTVQKFFLEIHHIILTIFLVIASFY